jgi:hypothetical protein
MVLLHWKYAKTCYPFPPYIDAPCVKVLVYFSKYDLEKETQGYAKRKRKKNRWTHESP